MADKKDYSNFNPDKIYYDFVTTNTPNGFLDAEKKAECMSILKRAVEEEIPPEYRGHVKYFIMQEAGEVSDTPDGGMLWIYRK